jgi:hypothetical protein
VQETVESAELEAGKNLTYAEDDVKENPLPVRHFKDTVVTFCARNARLLCVGSHFALMASNRWREKKNRRRHAFQRLDAGGLSLFSYLNHNSK